MSKNAKITLLVTLAVIVVVILAFLGISSGIQTNSSIADQSSNTQNTASNQTPDTSPVTSPAQASPNSKTVVVNYTDSGFSPKVVNIKAGDTVVFRDEASDQFWVASNPHPTHTDYPGFDSKKPLNPGESYSFTFTRVGQWGYHNHMNPTEGGTVIVSQ